MGLGSIFSCVSLSQTQPVLPSHFPAVFTVVRIIQALAALCDFSCDPHVCASLSELKIMLLKKKETAATQPTTVMYLPQGHILESFSHAPVRDYMQFSLACGHIHSVWTKFFST